MVTEAKKKDPSGSIRCANMTTTQLNTIFIKKKHSTLYHKKDREQQQRIPLAAAGLLALMSTATRAAAHVAGDSEMLLPACLEASPSVSESSTPQLVLCTWRVA
jgi:hypothetical protein